MHTRCLGHAFGLALVGILAGVGSLFAQADETEMPEAPAVAQAPIYTEQNASFEFAGTDRRSVRFMQELSLQVEQHCRKVLADKEVGYPSRIFVTLQPEATTELAEPVRVSFGERGSVRADFVWSENVTLDEACLALTEAYLLRFTYFNAGRERAAVLPQWVVSAIGIQAYVRLRPAIVVGLVEALRTQENVPLAAVFTAERLKIEDACWGYWYLSLLQDGGGQQVMLTKYLRSVLLSGNQTNGLDSLIAGAPTDGELDLAAWWTQGLDMIRSTNYERYESMADSRAWIGQLANVSGYELENGKTLKNLKDLWMLRNEVEIQQILKARREILLLRLSRVNPAYYNAARSLGGLYESVLQPDQMGDFIGALTTFLGDFEDTKLLDTRVQSELTGEVL